jgi:hypothetical protein
MSKEKWNYRMFSNSRIKYSCFIQSSSGDTICRMLSDDAPNNAIQEERAKLIAAAPDLLEALQKIAKWEMPPTGQFWDKEEKMPISYTAAYGSKGEMDFIKTIAKDAIKKATNP